MQQSSLILGIDVSAYWLDIHQLGSTTTQRINNTPQDILLWLTELPIGSLVGMESTGAYHLQLAKLAHAAGMVVYVLNPRNVHHYARGVGRRAKTDKQDAQIIARYLANERDKLYPWQPMTAVHEQLQSLFLRRSKLVKLRHALMMTTSTLEGVDDELDAALSSLKALIDRIERQIIHLSKQQAPDYVERFNALQSINGMGSLTGAYLAALFSRVPFRNSDQAVCFLGLDLKFSDSGKKRGTRKLSKQGPAEGRRLLYNAAAAAGRSVFRPMLNRYRERLPYAGAVNALARKLVKIAFAIWKSGMPFQMELYHSPQLAVVA